MCQCMMSRYDAFCTVTTRIRFKSLNGKLFSEIWKGRRSPSIFLLGRSERSLISFIKWTRGSLLTVVLILRSLYNQFTATFFRSLLKLSDTLRKYVYIIRWLWRWGCSNIRLMVFQDDRETQRLKREPLYFCLKFPLYLLLNNVKRSSLFSTFNNSLQLLLFINS